MRRLWILALGAFALGTDLFVIAGILPDVTRDLGVSTAMGGWLVSIFAFTYAVASPALAVATGNFDRRNLLTGSFAVFCIANAISAIAPGFWVLVMARFLAALGAALYMPTASALAAGLAPEAQRGRALSLVTGGMTAAIVLGVPLGTWIAGYASWRMTFWFIASIGVVALIGIRLWIPRGPNTGQIGWGARIALLRQSRVMVALLMTVLWTAGGFTVYPYLSVLLKSLTHLSTSAIGGMLLVFGVASVLGNYAGGYGADRWGTRATLALALVILMSVLATFAWSAPHLTLVVIAVALWGVAGWMLTPPQQHRLVAFAPQIPGAILGLNGSAIYLGIGLGTSVGALVSRQVSVQWFGLSGGLFEALALVVLAMSIVRQKGPSFVSESETLL